MCTESSNFFWPLPIWLVMMTSSAGMGVLNLYAGSLLYGVGGLDAALGAAPEGGLPPDEDAWTQTRTVAEILRPRFEEAGLSTKALDRVLEETASPRNGDAALAMARLSAVLRGFSPERYQMALESELGGAATRLAGARMIPDPSAREFLRKVQDMETHPPRGENRSPFREKYAILREIGKGRQSVVYLVQEKTTGRLFAAKRSRDPEQIELLQKEAEALENLNHPNIAKVHEHILQEDENGTQEFYLVSEYYHGAKSLEGLLETGRRFSQAELYSIQDQLLQALREAHAIRLVHRDLKPSNVLVQRSGNGELRVILIDFGLVKVLGGEAGVSSVGKGTIDWWSWEQINGEEVIPASDINALGLVLLALALSEPKRDWMKDQKPEGDLVKLRRIAVGSLEEKFINTLELMLHSDPNVRLSVLQNAALVRSGTTATAITRGAAEEVVYLSSGEALWKSYEQEASLQDVSNRELAWRTCALFGGSLITSIALPEVVSQSLQTGMELGFSFPDLSRAWYPFPLGAIVLLGGGLALVKSGLKLFPFFRKIFGGERGTVYWKDSDFWGDSSGGTLSRLEKDGERDHQRIYPVEHFDDTDIELKKGSLVFLNNLVVVSAGKVWNYPSSSFCSARLQCSFNGRPVTANLSSPDLEKVEGFARLQPGARIFLLGKILSDHIEVQRFGPALTAKKKKS